MLICGKGDREANLSFGVRKRKRRKKCFISVETPQEGCRPATIALYCPSKFGLIRANRKISRPIQRQRHGFRIKQRLMWEQDDGLNAISMVSCLYP